MARWQDIDVIDEKSEAGLCDCCRTTTNKVSGMLALEGATLAAFFVTWTQGKPDHRPQFTLVMGRWGEGSSPNDRYVAVVDMDFIEFPPVSCMLVDAPESRVGNMSSLATNFITRTAVGTPVAAEIFAMTDAIYLKAKAATELRVWAGNA